MAALRTLSVSLALLTGCAGAASTDLFDPVAQDPSGTEPTDDSGEGVTEATSSGAPGTSSGSSTGSSETPTDDAGATPSTQPPASVCLNESEPNGELKAADAFLGCIAGDLPTENDDDWAVIVAPASAKQIKIVHAENGGKVAYRVFVNGAPFPDFTDEPPAILPTIPGARYAFKIQPAGDSNTPRTWKLEVAFE